MSDSLVRHEQGASLAVAPLDIANELPQIFTLARALTKAQGFIPAHLKNESEIAAVLLAGRELGLGPMVSLRSLSMIKGRVVLAADVMLALMIRAGVKVEWQNDGSAAQGNVAKLKLSRPGHEPYVSSFSLDDAKLAGVASNDTYRKFQGAMLRARAVSAGARAYCPDVLSGCYVPGELGEEEPAAVRNVKPRRSLDDVAGAAPASFVVAASTPSIPTTRESDAIAAGMSDAAIDAARHEDESHDADGVAAPGTYNLDNHLAALPDVGVDALQAWVDDLAQWELTTPQRRTAWGQFVQRCMQLNVDPKAYGSK